MSYIKRSIFWGMLVLCLQGFTAQVYAKDYLHIQVIEAQKSNQYMDGKLKPLANKLINSFKDLNHFTKLKTVKIPLKNKAARTILLPKKLNMQIKIKTVFPQKFNFSIKIPKKKKALKINAKRNQLFFQAMKWKGKVYILALQTN